MMFDPFKKEFDQLEGKDLAALSGIEEGWYIEYKSSLIDSKSLMKAIGAFANKYGGWLLIGISNDKNDSIQSKVIGVPTQDIKMQYFDNIISSCINPTPRYNIRIIDGPCNEIGLKPGFSIVVIKVHQGSHPPYICNDGKIYIRTGESSIPVKDNHTLDLLFSRSAKNRKREKKYYSKEIKMVNVDKRNAFLHLFLFPSGYEYIDNFLDLNEFSSILRKENARINLFDNICSIPDGYLARSIMRNNRERQLYTFRLHSGFRAAITLPLQVDEIINCSRSFSYSDSNIILGFLNECKMRNMVTTEAINLSYLPKLVINCLDLYGKILQKKHIFDTIYAKIRINGGWNRTPFINSNSYIDYIKENDHPIIQQNKIYIPPLHHHYLSLHEIVKLGESDDDYKQKLIVMASLITFYVFKAVGYDMGEIDEQKGREFIQHLGIIFTNENRNQDTITDQD